MKALLDFLSSIYPVSEDLRANLYQRLKYQRFDKKSFLLKEGNLAENVFYVEKGLVRCFYEKNGKEVSSWFMKEGDVIVSVESFFQQKPSKETIQALEDCDVYSISYTDLKYIYLNFPEFNFIGRILTEKYYILCEQRLYSLRMQKAKERQEYFQDNNPDLVQRVTAQHIASYLGITMETYSRAKRKSRR